jgi:hypothetical protein
MSWANCACGALMVLPLALYSCRETPTVTSPIQIASSAPVPTRCLEVKDGNQKRARVCWEKDVSGGTALSVLDTPAQCIVARQTSPERWVRGPKYQLGYAVSTDDPDRDLIQLSVSRERPVFVLDVAGGDGDAFGPIAQGIEGEVRIELYPEVCEEVCPQMVGDATIVLSAQGVRAYRNDPRARCGIFDFKSQNRQPAASEAAPASSAPSSNAAAAAPASASAAPAASASAAPAPSAGVPPAPSAARSAPPRPAASHR